jgi:AcrR family transcriptional regulator
MRAKKQTDRRTQRTRRQLSGALNQLIEEKRFDDITVQNVIDRADVGRATFYSHFRDKEDLFEQQWERGMHQLAQQIDWDKAGKDSFFPAAVFFRHLQEVQPFYRGLVRSRKIDAIFKSGIEYLSRDIETSLNERLQLVNPRSKVATPLAVPVPILSNYIGSEFFALLKWWLDAGMPYPPESMDKFFHNLVNPTLRSALRIGND